MPPSSPAHHFISPTLRALLAVALAILVAGCEKSEHFFMLNPDGSGRVTAKEEILTSNMGIEGREALQHAAISTLAEMILVSEGVDAWEAVSYTITDSGDLILEATALFPDLAKLDLASSAQVPALAKNLKFEKASKGKPASIELASPISAADPQKIPAGLVADEKSIATELAKARQLWLDQEKNIRPEYGEKKAKITFHFSGELTSQSNFKKDAKNQVSLQVSAPRVLDTLSRVIADDELAKEGLRTGAKFFTDDGAPPIKAETFNEFTFGEAKPLRFEFTPGVALFDYRAAVDAAKADPSPLLRVVQSMADRAAEK